MSATHGRYSTYSNHRCRCGDCREAARVHAEQARRRRGVPTRAEYWASLGRTHGRIATYNSGCRCEDCTRAARDYQRRMRSNRKARANG